MPVMSLRDCADAGLGKQKVMMAVTNKILFMSGINTVLVVNKKSGTGIYLHRPLNQPANYIPGFG